MAFRYHGNQSNVFIATATLHKITLITYLESEWLQRDETLATEESMKNLLVWSTYGHVYHVCPISNKMQRTCKNIIQITESDTVMFGAI